MLNGEDFRRKPFARKAALRKLLRRSGEGIQYVEHTEGDGEEIFQAACKLGLGDCFKTNRRAVSLRSRAVLAQDQKSQSTGSNAGRGWYVLSTGTAEMVTAAAPAADSPWWGCLVIGTLAL